MSIEIRVRFFAAVREMTGMVDEQLTIDEGLSVGDLFADLANRHPGLKSLKTHLRWAVNLDFVDESHTLKDGDEVAIIPPIAGGSVRARVTDQPLDAARISNAVRRVSDGAVVTFEGVVRNHSQDRDVDHLEYEVFEEMALAKLDEIADETEQKWPECRVLVEHRIGRLEVGDCAVVIAVSSPHRKDAFQGCQYVIDRIKQIVPIWKREVGPDGSCWVGLGS